MASVPLYETPPRPDPRGRLVPKRGLRPWVAHRWHENPPLINFASVALLALGLAQVAIGILLLKG